MGIWQLLQAHWFDVIQSVGIVAGLLFTAYTTIRSDRARRVGNSLAVSSQHREIWTKLISHPELSRVLSTSADLKKMAVSHTEEVFVNLLIQHLATVYRAMKEGEFVRLEGLENDVREFFSLPIAGAVWQKRRPLQDKAFVAFVDDCLNSS